MSRQSGCIVKAQRFLWSPEDEEHGGYDGQSNQRLYPDLKLKERVAIEPELLTLKREKHWQVVVQDTGKVNIGKKVVVLTREGTNILRMLANNRSIRIRGAASDADRWFGVLERLVIEGSDYQEPLKAAIWKFISKHLTDVNCRSQDEAWDFGGQWCLSGNGKAWMERVFQSTGDRRGIMPSKEDVGEMYWDRWFSRKVVERVARDTFRGVVSSELYDDEGQVVAPFGQALASTVRRIIRLQCGFIAVQMQRYWAGQAGEGSKAWEELSQRDWFNLDVSKRGRPEPVVADFFREQDLMVKEFLDGRGEMGWPKLKMWEYKAVEGGKSDTRGSHGGTSGAERMEDDW